MIYVVGIGPGLIDHMSIKAMQAIRNSDVIVGYQTYVALIRTVISDRQQVYTTPMRGEIDRCQQALEYARAGQTVALISGGDAGVYGMAGLMLEIVIQSASDIEVEVIPGIPAANAAAASIGAPLMHDYVTISLSDLLTDWELIRKRIHCAGQGDFVVAIYNPKSQSRTRQIIEAQEILLQYKSPDTPVGIVRNAKRSGEEIELTTLADLADSEINMSTMVIVGNSKTYLNGRHMITPRGYRY